MSVLSRLPALAPLLALGLSPALVSASPTHQADLVGWYQLPDGQDVVLSWAADGDLRLSAARTSLRPTFVSLFIRGSL